jgi:hypothetical protein
MSSGFWAALLIAVVGLVISLSVPIAYRTYHQRRLNALNYQRAWHWLAARTGLTFEPGQYAASPRLVGKYRGRALTLDLQVAQNRSASTHTRVHLALPLVNTDHRLTPERRSGLAGLWRRSEIFERRYVLTAQPATLGLALLGSTNLKRKLAEAAPERIDLQPDGLRLLADGIVDDPERLAFFFDVLSEAARLLEGAQRHAALPELEPRPAPTLAEAES